MNIYRKIINVFLLGIIFNFLIACENKEFTNCVDRYEDRYLAEQYSLMHAKSKAVKSCKHFK